MIGGFSPDSSPVDEGILTDCANLLPTLKGMKAAYQPVATTLPALATAVQGAVVARKVDNSTRLIAGTATALYEGAGSSYTTVTRVTGGAYTGGAESRWRFAQVGNVTIATNRADVMQTSSAGAFVNLSASAIKAACIDTVGEFVMAGDTSDATYGDAPDRVWWSAFADHTNWTPAISTQCGTLRLTDSPGRIRAVKTLGDNVVVYKDRAMYVATYNGPPTLWGFELLPGDIGTPAQETVVNIGPAHIFMGYEDFYLFDGSRPVSIGNPIREWFFADLNKSYAHLSTSLHDRINSRIWFYYPSIRSSTAIDSAVVYNYKSDKWGRDNRAIQATVEYIAAAATFDSLASVYPTLDGLPAIPFDSPFWAPSAQSPAVYDTTNTLKTLTGAATTSSFTTGDYGDDDRFILLTRVKPRFLLAPTSARMESFSRFNLGDALTVGPAATMQASRFDLLRSSRWHRIKLNFVGDMEIIELKAQFAEAGYE